MRRLFVTVLPQYCPGKMGTAKTQGAAYAAPENRERRTENRTRDK